MEISSVANTLIAPKATEKFEGNRPDGDGDRDDAVQNVSAKATTALATSGTIGTKLNVTA